MLGERDIPVPHSSPIAGRGARKNRHLHLPTLATQRSVFDALGRSTWVQIMLAMSLVALAAMIYLAQASQASVIGVNITNLQDQQAHLLIQRANLHAEVTSLQSLTRIETLATSQLKMTRADLSTALWVQPDKPAVAPIQTDEGDTQAAERRSEPLSWMSRAIHSLLASL